MAGNIRLEVVTPEREVVNDEARIVMAPGSEGEFGVLVGHTPFMTSLKTGTLRYHDGTGTERSIFVSGGFAEALPDKVVVLAESAERQREIDAERARSALERARERLASKQAEIDYARARAALERALNRIKLVESHGRG